MYTFEQITKKALELNPGLNSERFRKAYEYAKTANEGRTRISGESYIEHDLSVIDILLSFNPDEDTLIAAMLHDCEGGREKNEENIKKQFGKDVSFLVNSVDALKGIKFSEQNIDVESLRQMFISMAKDIRAIVIRLADRLDNLKNMQFYSREDLKLLARESLDVYVPICSRLGIYRFKTLLEDYAFKCLYPDHYSQLSVDLDEYMSKRQLTLDDINRELFEFLQNHNIEAKVEGRIKNLYSIYRKLKIKNLTALNELHDIFAMRIVLRDKTDSDGKESYDHLYAVLGLIHSNWRPLTHRFKDYIAVPKPNGYRSLHTAVVGMSSNLSQSTEIQIRTEMMHNEAEFGVASHWIYDVANKKSVEVKNALGLKSASFENYRKLAGVLSKMQKEIGTGKDFFDILQFDIFSDRIFVMTPKGEVKDLPKGATPVDFAYAVHSDVGHRCNLAKVNGAVVPLDYQLNNGEVVEIITGNKANPKLSWLSVVKTTNAKNKIRNFFGQLEKDKSFRVGREIMNKYLVQMDRPPLDENLSLLRDYGGKRLTVKERMSLLEEIGAGSVLALPVLKNLFGVSGLFRERKLDSVSGGRNRKQIVKKEDDIIVAGERDLPYRLANCCKPKKGLPIIGYVGRNKCVTIHLEKCRILRDANEQRIVSAGWGDSAGRDSIKVKLEVLSGFRLGIIRDISAVIAENGGNILFFNDIGKSGEGFKREIQLEAENEISLVKIEESIRGVRNVMGVRRV